MRGYADPYGETYIFNVSGFKLVLAFANGAVAAIDYEPETPLTYKQAKEILAKNANVTWKREAEISEEDMVWLDAKSKHDLRAMLYYGCLTLTPPKFDRNSIESLVVVGETVNTQKQKENEVEDKEKKAKEAEKTQSDVNGL